MQNHRRIQSERLRVRSDPGDAFDSVFQQVVVGKQFLGLHPIFPVAPGSHVFTSAFPALRDRRSGPPLGEVHEPSPGRKRGGRKGRATGWRRSRCGRRCFRRCFSRCSCRCHRRRRRPSELRRGRRVPCRAPSSGAPYGRARRRSSATAE